MNKMLGVIIPAAALISMSSLVVADSDTAQVQALMQRIDTLEQRIVQLEAARSFTGFMPDFAERLHVMHRAAEAGDWTVASHELSEMRRIAGLSTAIDQEKGELMQVMLEPSFEELEDAINDGDTDKFQKVLDQTVTTCNSCHVATGSPFIEVTMDVPGSLNMRHPHAFSQQAAVGGHAHGGGMDPQMMGKGGAMMGGAQGHDDSEAPHGESEAKHDDSEAPHGESEAKHDDSEAPHGESEVKHDDSEAPHDDGEKKHAG